MAKIKRLRRNKASALMSKKTKGRGVSQIDTDLLSQIDTLFKAGRLDDAENVLNQLLSESPGSAMLYAKLAELSKKRGKIAAAEEYFRKALKIDREFLPALISLGELEAELGNLNDALATYNKALKISPDNCHTMNAMGRLFLKVGNFDMSRNLFEEVVRLEPNSAEGLYGLGRVNAAQGRYSEAEINYRLAFLNKPDYDEAYNSLGIMQAHMGRYDEAEKSYCKALEIRPDNVDALCDLGELYEKRSKLQESKEVVGKALTISPDNLFATRIMATLLRREGSPQDGLKMLEVVAIPENNPAKASEIHYELAKTYDRLGRYEKAYDNFYLTKKFQALEPGSQRFDKNNFLRDLQTLRNYFTEEHLENIAGEASDDVETKPVFLVGFPRSGTTLMDQILDSHPDFSVAEETVALDSIINKIKWAGKGYPEALDELDQETIKGLRKDYFRGLKKCLGGKPNGKIVDKYPLHIIHLGLIAKLFPGARVIVALRHPYDVCLSNFMQLFRLNDAMANFTNLVDTANCYDQVMGLGLRYMEHLPLEFHRIKYEDLVENFTETTQKLLRFLGVDWDEKVVKYYEHARSKTKINTPSYQQVTEPIYKRAVFRFVNYAAFFPKETDVLKFYVERFGYENVDEVLPKKNR